MDTCNCLLPLPFPLLLHFRSDTTVLQQALTANNDETRYNCPRGITQEWQSKRVTRLYRNCWIL